MFVSNSSILTKSVVSSWLFDLPFL